MGSLWYSLGFGILGLALMLGACYQAASVPEASATDILEQEAEATDAATETVAAPTVGTRSFAIGAILAGSAGSHGWRGLRASGNRYYETEIDGNQIVFFPYFNAEGTAPVELDRVVEGLIERNARFIFLPSEISEDDRIRLTQAYQDVIFLHPSNRAEVERLLRILGSNPVVATQAPRTQPTAVQSGTPITRLEPRDLPEIAIVLACVSFACFILAITAPVWLRRGQRRTETGNP